jgi:glycerophosphodiester phosphodiesterase
MHISNAQLTAVQRNTRLYYKQRSRSLSLSDDCWKSANDLTERMKHTFEYKKIGFKGNTRGNYIHQPFLSLGDVLSHTPDSIALNIEISKQHSSFFFLP